MKKCCAAIVAAMIAAVVCAMPVPVAALAQSTLSVGQRVKTTANVTVPNKPTNARRNVICIQTTGSVGTILDGRAVAGGSILWNVNFDSKCDGWAVQNHLVADGVTPPPPPVVPPSLPVLPPPPPLPPPPTADLEAVPTFNQDTAQQFTLFVQRTGIQPSEVGVIVNESDPQSVEVANYFKQKHVIPDSNTIHVNFGGGATWIDNATFAAIKSQIIPQLTPTMQVLAITWTAPWSVDAKQSITSAITFGFGQQWGPDSSCSATALNPYYNHASGKPFTDLGIRPSMMVGGWNSDGAKKLIDNSTLAFMYLPTGDGYFVKTWDTARNVRWQTFQSTVSDWNAALTMYYVDDTVSGDPTNKPNVLFYQTGLATVPDLTTNQFLPGSVGDTLTSVAGVLWDGGQMSALEWLAAGASGSYGTVIEPCNYTQKFPNSSVLVNWYFSGNTLIEAYWKSVQWPGQGLFVGDPLARPFGTKGTFSGGVLTIITSIMKPNTSYALYWSNSASGPWTLLQNNISVWKEQYKTITDSSGLHPFYKFVQQ
jgi:uncharacterized protein (TIGR03790 family)